MAYNIKLLMILMNFYLKISNNYHKTKEKLSILEKEYNNNRK